MTQDLDQKLKIRGRLIRWARERAGMSIKAVADAVNEFERTIEEIERGQVLVGIDRYARILSLFEMTPAHLGIVPINDPLEDADVIEIVTRRTASGPATSASTERHIARFEPVRTVRKCTIGWATVSGNDYTYRFPAIVDLRYDEPRVLTVGDWQAPASVFASDLANPEDVAEQVSSGQGAFVTSTGQKSVTSDLFVH